MKKYKKTKKCVAIIFGGKSAEHEVSIQSARNVLKVINKAKYNILLIGIDKSGSWFSFDEQKLLSGEQLFSQRKIIGSNTAIPHIKGKCFYIKNNVSDKKIDVVFPLVHGPFGEDGTLQGVLKLFNVPFVGASVLGSAIGMDKDVSKRLLREAGIPVARFFVYKRHQKKDIFFEKLKKTLKLPFFVKPANLGSSVGINKVKNKSEFVYAVETAFSYDNKIIIEEFIKGKEIECSILGNENPISSIPGEIAPHHEFYSYEAKYLDKDGAALSIPASISKSMTKEIQEMALKVFDVLCCEGMGRVDFFVTPDNQIFVNEINTIPGFTSISMYPKLWEFSGISYVELIDSLIELAFYRHKMENRLKVV